MKNVTFLIALVMVLAFATAGIAQQKAAPEGPAAPAAAAPEKIKRFAGRIHKVDAAAKTIAVKAKKKAMTFVTDPATKITKGNAEMTFADLKKGMYVSVRYKKGGDKLIAVTVKAAAPKVAKKRKAK